MRRSITLALLLLVVLAVAQLSVNLDAIASSAFLLRRAEASYRQLSAYRQLSMSLLEFVLANRDAGAATETTAQRQNVERDLAGIDTLEVYENQLVRDHGGDETNTPELERLAQIRSTVRQMLAVEADDGPSRVSTAATIYTSVLKPVLATAIDGEQAEIATVEQAMRNLQARIAWIGRLGILGQILAVLLVMRLVARAVLDPISRLVADIRELGRGRLGHRVHAPRHDEFGLLANHINRMARHLERGRLALVTMNHGLEATVAERTRSLEEKNHELREIDDSRRRFFADVSHELRTPLTAIVGEADVTLRFAKDDGRAYPEALSSILANATYLNRRIDDLMALARSSNGQVSLHAETVDLNLIATEAMAEIDSLARLNGVTVRFEPLDRPVLVDGDRLRLRQCLMILLDNAVKFSRANQAIDIRLDDFGARADITVVDRGTGIDIEDLPHVFERFYQTEVGRRMGGTGLGLSIARRIVEAHGGAIAASSDSGRTSIAITLPTLEEIDA